MEDQLISFEAAVLAKEKGFNYKSEYYLFPNNKRDGYNLIHKNHYFPNFSTSLEQDYFSDYYSLVIPNPTQSLLQKWLREVHNIHIDIGWTPKNNSNDVVWWSLFGFIGTHDYTQDCFLNFETYEEAFEHALQEALKLI